MGLEVAYKEFVGLDACFLELIHPLSYINADIASQVSDGEEGVLKITSWEMSLR